MNSDKSLIEQISDDIVREFGSELPPEQLELMYSFACVGIAFKISKIMIDVAREIDKK